MVCCHLIELSASGVLARKPTLGGELQKNIGEGAAGSLSGVTDTSTPWLAVYVNSDSSRGLVRLSISTTWGQSFFYLVRLRVNYTCFAHEKESSRVTAGISVISLVDSSETQAQRPKT